MKKDEELGPDRGFEFETDDEENEAENEDGGDEYSASSDERREEEDDYDGEGVLIQPSWPQSYRQSIDIFSNVLSPKLDLQLAGSSLIQVGNSFLRGPPPELPSFTKPLLGADDTPSSPHPAAVPSPKPSFHRASFASSYLPDLPIPKSDCSTAQSLVNGINVLCGVGILATPYAVKEGGWLGLLVLFVFSLISCYTGFLLMKCLDNAPGSTTYPDIGQAAFGMYGRICFSIIIYVELYACCVQYITLMSNSLESIFPDASLSLGGVILNSHQLFAVMTTITVLPTTWLKNLGLLSYISFGGVIATVLVASCLLWAGTVDAVGFHSGGTLLDIAHLPVALGLYGFCYSGHAVFPSIYSNMRTRSHFPTVLVASFIICTFLYFGVAVAGFMMFGESIKTQFTLNLPQDYISSKVAIWTTVVNPLTKYALTMTPVALSLEELVPKSRESHLIAVAMRSVLVVSTLVVALSIPFFGIVMAFLGSLFTMLVTIILPCACYLSIQRASVNSLQVTVCVFIMLIGAVCACIGSYTSVKQIVHRLG